MEDKKVNYTIQWQQVYDNWYTSEWLDAAIEAITEFDIEQGNLHQAQAVIDRIRKL